jgi:hypothetical protein
MKVKLSIDQASKSGFFSGTSHSYTLNVQFTPNEKEKKIFNDHPLFQTMLFMRYTAGKNDKKYREGASIEITAKDIYEAKPILIEATSVNEIVKYRNEINDAAETFVNYINILTDILGGRELSYGE